MDGRGGAGDDEERRSATPARAETETSLRKVSVKSNNFT